METLETNATLLEANVTFEQIASALNVNITSLTNESEAQAVIDLYDEYRVRERELLLVYKSVGYVLGTLIILSNLTVVVSSGLILRKGQQPKSTYLLLGNVSLADTIIGISLIFGTIIDNTTVNSNPLCIFQIGMVVCPTMVSIFSVGFIAIDRYIYILHGLYYQRWINATRVRIGIVIIWIIGLVLGFLPAAGWTNNTYKEHVCLYSHVFPTNLIIFNCVISLVPIILVAVLYTIILKRALRNAKDIKSEKSITVFGDNSKPETPKLRAIRGNLGNNKILVKPSKRTLEDSLGRCVSASYIGIDTETMSSVDNISKSCGDINQLNDKVIGSIKNVDKSDLSIWTVDSISHDTSGSNHSAVQCKARCCIKKLKCNLTYKRKEPCRSRGIVVVLLTTGSFLISWIPFFVLMMAYVIFCQDAYANSQCVKLKEIYLGPITIFAFTSCIFNPLIYAWWHKGFKNAVKNYFKRYFAKEKLRAAFKKRTKS